MHFHEQSTGSSVRILTLTQAVIKWRDEWRADVAARRGDANDNWVAKSKPAASPRLLSPARGKATNFAIAVARDEFGRFYWNGTLARQLAQALAAGPRRKTAGTSKPARPPR